MHGHSNKVSVAFNDGHKTACPPGTPVKAVMRERKSAEGLDYRGAMVNHDVVSLSYPLEVDSTVHLLTRADSHGFRIYRRSVCFLLAKTVKELYPAARFSVEHSLGSGFYCSFDQNGHGHELPDAHAADPGIKPSQLEAIERRMRELIQQNIPIERRKISFTEAVKQFEKEGQGDKYSLLRFRNPPKIVIFWCDGFSDLGHGPLAESTGSLNLFHLIPYPPGFVIQFPEREKPTALPPFEPQPHLFRIFREHKEWGRIVGVRTVGHLNEIIAKRHIGDFIKIAEAFHEKRIAQIADHISAHRSRIKWVLIAGPSASGKTTLAKRLAIQLQVDGLRTVTVSVDNYFVDREKTPRDEKGEYDFENIETIDLKLLNEHLHRLDQGGEVEIPHYDFENGRREFRGEKMKIEPDQLVLVEGIHALNPRLTHSVPVAHKLKIYVSALTQLNLDFNNRISTTDNRLVRRLVRDNMFRGNTALMTLSMWPNVRRGEKTWIFPFQQEADMAFNSALDYELAVLKPLIEPLLSEVKPDRPEYAEARRLQDFLASFLSVPEYLVPPTSILREFTGRSAFRY
jgi:uridine kinase